MLLPGEDECCIGAWVNHRSYPLELERQDEGNTIVKFLLSGAKTPETYELNTLFLENWYKYQDHVVRTGGEIDLIQVLSVRRMLPFPSFLFSPESAIVGA